jgi:hypothetical protein
VQAKEILKIMPPQDLRFNMPPWGYDEENLLDSTKDVRLGRLTKQDDLMAVLVGLKKTHKNAANLKEIYPNSILVGRRNISLPENVSTVAGKIIKALENKIKEEFPDIKILETIAIFPYPVPESEGVCNHTIMRITIGSTDRINLDVDACIGRFGNGISDIYTVKSMKS